MVRSVLWVSAFLIVFPATSMAADKYPTMTDLSQVDADYAFQGEYTGTITTGPSQWESVGLQVVALGDGQFSAMLYSGGLPGAGWDRREHPKYTGGLEGSQVVFSSYPTRITVNGSQAVITDDRYPSFEQGQLAKTYRSSPTMGAPAPYNATVLFDGTNTDHFEGGRMTDDGLLIEGTQLKDRYKNFKLHAEFRLPYMPAARDQARANSGLYLQSRYEVQILDSFGLDPVYNNCGSLYKQRPADLNMCLPPLTWQTYDIDFAAPKFDAHGKKIQNARITVRLNGVPVHNDIEILAKTGAGKPEGPDPLPIKIQDHSNPVRFRNIWVVDYGNNPPPRTQPSEKWFLNDCDCWVTICE